MKYTLLQYDTLDSTNRFLLDYTPKVGEEMTVVAADYQTGGRGQGGNSWESKSGKNLLFSILIHPLHIAPRRQFILSMTAALAQKNVLDTYTSDITLKWPNDVYWKDKKLGGTLIETRLTGNTISDCIIGTGINVNQDSFDSDAPNPVSLLNIIGHKTDRDELLKKILITFCDYYEMTLRGDHETIIKRYHEALYRRTGFFRFADDKGCFEAEIIAVEDDGHIILHRTDDTLSRYAFKEVSFVI